ncbi:MAG: bifunctional heptose 7-phosphate kinase/heptose 1-phosphate adenyltransferase, partial [Planctomycetota bacterium]
MTCPTRSRMHELIAAFRGKRVAVVGDMLADVYIYGRPYRLSREAPVVVMKHEGEEVIPGGAANTANNLAALGAVAVPVGVLGDDPPGLAVVEALGRAGMDTHGLITAAGNATVSKTRVLAGGHSVSKQQIVRIDRDGTLELPDDAAAQLAEAVRGLAGTVDGVIVSDYGYNVCTDAVVAAVREVAASTPVLVDSHHRLPDFAGAAIATPNEEEMEFASGVDVDDEAALREAGRALRAGTDLDALLITRGNRGMMLVEESAVETIPIVGPSDVADVTGAGDTV